MPLFDSKRGALRTARFSPSRCIRARRRIHPGPPRAAAIVAALIGVLLSLLPAGCGPQPVRERRPPRTLRVERQIGPPPKKNVEKKAQPAAKADAKPLGTLTSADGGETWDSAAGLRYGPGPDGNRLDHVLRHAKDRPTRPSPHGVFEGDRKQILALIDEAYQLVKAKSDRVQFSGQGKRSIYTIDMQRRIGYVGGKPGKEQGHPEARHLRLVLEGTNVITAFPLRK